MMKIFQKVLIAIAIIIPFMVQAQDDSVSRYDKPRFNSYIYVGANIDLNKMADVYMSYGVGVDYRRPSIMVGYEGISSHHYKIIPPQEKTPGHTLFGHTIFLNVGVRIGR